MPVTVIRTNLTMIRAVLILTPIQMTLVRTKTNKAVMEDNSTLLRTSLVMRSVSRTSLTSNWIGMTVRFQPSIDLTFRATLTISQRLKQIQCQTKSRTKNSD